MGENAPRLPTRPDLGTFEFVSDPGALRRVWPGLREQAGALLEALTPAGRVHAAFKPLGTETGRFSSSDPNLQNIVRGPLRGCFEPNEPGRILVVADYSQIELRVAAWFAGDQTMLQAFRAGQDLHTLTAATVLNKPATEVTKAERSSAAGGCLVRMPPIGIGSRPK